jgi:hypothetical protein
MNVELYTKTNFTGYFCTQLATLQGSNQFDLRWLKGSSTFFLVKRVENWETEKMTLFDTSTVALSFTLAAMFLVTSIYAGYRLILLIRYTMIVKSKPGIETVMLSSLLLFNLSNFLNKKSILIFFSVRSIYFWILPQGIDSATADYVLVVLPSFLFLSTFTLVVSLWFVLVFPTKAQIFLKGNCSSQISHFWHSCSRKSSHFDHKFIFLPHFSCNNSFFQICSFHSNYFLSWYTNLNTRILYLVRSSNSWFKPRLQNEANYFSCVHFSHCFCVSCNCNWIFILWLAIA